MSNAQVSPVEHEVLRYSLGEGLSWLIGEYVHPDEIAWRAESSCVDVSDPAIFFPEAGDHAGRAAAKEICAGCASRSQCLEYALVTNQKHGIWGGLTRSERKRLPRTLAAFPATLGA